MLTKLQTLGMVVCQLVGGSGGGLFYRCLLLCVYRAQAIIIMVSDESFKFCRGVVVDDETE